MWTEGRVRSFITSTIRSGFRRWPEKFEVLKEAFIRKGVNPNTGRVASLYQCATCKKEFSSKDVQVDHIEPVVDPKEGFKTWDEFISRLFCSKENLQVLCKECHKIKSNEERQIRKKNNE